MPLFKAAFHPLRQVQALSHGVGVAHNQCCPLTFLLFTWKHEPDINSLVGLPSQETPVGERESELEKSVMTSNLPPGAVTGV